MDRMMSQGTWLLISTCTIISNLDAMRTEVEKTKEAFSKELETQEKDFESWLKFEDYDSDDLIQNVVIPLWKMYIKQREALEH